MKHRLTLIVAVIVLVLVVGLLVEYLIIKYSGEPVPPPVIPRESQSLGKGPKLNYVIMGDSTAIGQGTTYDNSYAVASARHLAEKYQVNWINVGESGAKTSDVLAKQLTKTVAYKPDVVLIAAGSNDANHEISGKETRTSLQQIVDGLKKSNSDVRIVVTGSAAIDAVPRYIWPYKQYRGLRTQQVNRVFESIINTNHLNFAPIAAKTRQAFLADPSLFAADKFHPNARGYQLWATVINKALDEVLAKSPL